jgi:flagellar motility protein MotE (MotC chaperone)
VQAGGRKALRALVVCAVIVLSVVAYAATASVTEAAEGIPAPAHSPSAAAPAAAPATASDEGVRTLAAALERRARALDEREHTITARESGIRDAQAKLDTRLTELTAIRTAISADLDRSDERRETRIAALVTMVESNRASAIAPMFGALEVPLAVDVLDRMNRQKAGKLLAALPPARAAVFATRMASPIVVAP